MKRPIFTTNPYHEEIIERLKKRIETYKRLLESDEKSLPNVIEGFRQMAYSRIDSYKETIIILQKILGDKE